MRAIWFVGFLFMLFAAPALAALPIPSAHGTATIDGVKSAGEWDAASPLYVMDDDVNIYLGLFVPDSILTNDVFWTRFDSKHDGITMAGDDEVNGTATNFFDSHFDGVSW